MAESPITIVVALGLIGGAVYLATRKPAADAGPKLNGDCAVAEVASKAYGYAGGGAACEYFHSLAKPITDWVHGECSTTPRYYGNYLNKQDGFTGRCYFDKSGKVIVGIGQSAAAKAGLSYMDPFPTQCCPPGKKSEKCTPGPKWAALPGYCKNGFAGIPLPDTYDHRKGAHGDLLPEGEK